MYRLVFQMFTPNYTDGSFLDVVCYELSVEHRVRLYRFAFTIGWKFFGINIKFPTLMHPLGGWFFMLDVTGA